MLELSINDPVKLAKVAHALSSTTRLGIMKLLLTQNKLNIIEMAEKLNLPVSTVGVNVKVLEEAGLILTELLPASRGAMKVCSRNFDDVRMILNPIAGYKNQSQSFEIEMPLGHFTDFEVHPTCGIADQNGMLIPVDDPSSFYFPGCKSAEIIWFRLGWLEYRFPKTLPQNVRVTSIDFSMELCSEAPNFNNVWPSDITVWINGKEIGTWTSPGDFGDRRGKNNPTWWEDTSTQYGLLKTFRVDDHRATVDNQKLSETVLQDLQLEKYPFVRFKIGIKPDAEYKGGINLFGRGFGDYLQAIVMKIKYEQVE